MDISGINGTKVLNELRQVLSLEFTTMLTDLGYIEKRIILESPESLSDDERQQSIALAARRARNEQILQLVFESPKYRTVARRLQELMEGWDQNFLRNYFALFDFEITEENVHVAISNLNLSLDHNSFWLGMELPGYCPSELHNLNDYWQIRPLTHELLEGLDADSNLIRTVLQSKRIPGTYDLDHANGFLMKKTDNPFRIPPVGDVAALELLLIQLSPVVIRVHKLYAIKEDDETHDTTAQQIPSQTSHLRLRIPVPTAYLCEFVDDISWILNQGPKLQSHPKIRIALERYTSALFYYTAGLGPGSLYDDAIHDAVIGLESLLMSENVELAYRFQTVLSRIMPEAPSVGREFLKRIYTQRSKVAHEGKTSGKYQATNLDVFQTISLLNAAIRWYLRKADTMSSDEITKHLDKLPFGNEKDEALSPWGSISDVKKYPPSEKGPWVSRSLT